MLFVLNSNFMRFYDFFDIDIYGSWTIFS